MTFTLKQYDEIAKQYELSESSILKRYSNGATLVSLCGDLAGKSVIDLACGSGFSTRLVNQVCNPGSIYGIDISKEEIALAHERENNRPLGIKYYVDDVGNFDFKQTGLFDTAIALFLLNYCSSKEELYRLCQNIYSGLKCGGNFIAVVPNSDTPIIKTKKYDVTVDMKSPIREGDIRIVTYYLQEKKLCSFNTYFWTRETYTSVLSDAGFEAIEVSQPIVSDAGYKKYGKEFWREFLNHPHSLGISCIKK